MERIPEPELMDSEAQASAYAEADFSDANTLFCERYLERFGGRETHGQMLDLGCGPGDICLRMARALPGWSVTGLDAGPNMLKHARNAVQQAGLEDRVALRRSYLPDPGLARSAFQAVISNSLLHHLPDPATLWKTVQQVAAPAAYVQVMDLARPDSAASARATVEQHAADAPAVLKTDFYNSLLAAYTPEEVVQQLGEAGLEGLEISRPSDRHWLVAGRLAG